MNSASIPSTILTIQKFLSAFLDRVSKAKNAIETIDPKGKEVNDSRQLSTRIMQQWNVLFPNSPIHCVDSVTSNALIATKAREEVILERTTQQKIKLMMEVEILRHRLQQQQQELSQLQEEITKNTHSINEQTLSLENLKQQQQNMQLTITSLQSQKQKESTTLQTLQSSKLSILEELVSLQQAISSQRTSLQALVEERNEHQKKLDQMKNQKVLMEQSIALLVHQQHVIQAENTHPQAKAILQDDRENADKSIPSEGSTTQSETVQIDLSSTETGEWNLSGWSGYRTRKRHRRDFGRELIVCKRSHENIFDDSFWLRICLNKQ